MTAEAGKEFSSAREHHMQALRDRSLLDDDFARRKLPLHAVLEQEIDGFGAMRLKSEFVRKA